MKRTLKTVIILCLLPWFGQAQSFVIPEDTKEQDSLFTYVRDLIEVDLQEGMRYSRKLSSEALQRNDSGLLAQSLLLQGTASLQLHKYSAAENSFYKALSFAKRSNDSSLLSKANYFIGTYKYKQGDQFQAISLFETALNYNGSTSPHARAMSHYYLAKINLELDKDDQALKEARKMQDVVKSMRLESLKGASLNLLGRVSLHLGELDRARAYLQNAEVANRKFGNEQQLANTYALQARSWQQLNNPNKAMEAIDQAIATIKPTREKDEYIQHLILQSEIAREQGEDSTALKSALKADSLARSINAMGPVMRQVYQQMADLNLTIGDSAAALRNYLSLQSVNDSLRARNIREMLLEKENTQQRAQLEALDTENQQKEITISRSKILLFAAAGAIVVISLLLVALWRSSVRRKRYSKHLLTKNKEIHNQKKKLSEQQEELLEKNKQLQELDKNKNKIFSVLSHDLRQPINQIRSILDLIENEELSAAERKQIVISMRQSLDNSSNALENLLLWSKNQLTGISTKIVDVHLLPQVWQLESHLKPTLETKNLKLELDIPDFFKVPADMNQLDICLKNLVNNAIKFSNTGGSITIKAYQKNSKKYIDVSDEGVGMTPDQLTKLRKLNGSFSTLGTMNEKGTGLGIMITQDFMINQNGDLEVESTPGKGTTFSMVFPKGEDRPRRNNGSLRKI